MAFAQLHTDGLPSAIIAITDITAIGILVAAREAGIAVPEHLSVIGYDDVPAAAWTAPALTTVHQPIREKGRLAAERLVALLRGDGERPPTTELLPTHLVVRESTAPAHTSGRLRDAQAPSGGGGVAHL